jgi:CrcB protein
LENGATQASAVTAIPPSSLTCALNYKKGQNVAVRGLLAVGGGAAIGASLRWWLGILLNSVFPTLPLGTLAANLLGGYLMGLSVGWITHFESLPPDARLFIMTGFLGGLTTFSTFSAETVSLMLRHQYHWVATEILVHVAGSLTMTLCGIVTIQLLRG